MCIALIIILLILVVGLVLLSQQVMLPKSINERIRALQSADVPELITGKTGFAQNEMISIFYEVISKDTESKGDIILINGHSHSLLEWPKHFYIPFVEAGYRVIRFDNRGVGNSDWMKNWSKENAYKLEDMATDVLAVLDALQIDQAHVIGMSMGGMIGQRLAISHGERVKSLTAIMSTGFYFDPKLVSVPWPFYLKVVLLMLTYGRDLKKESNKIKFHVAIQRLLMGKGGYAFQEDTHIRNALYEIRKRRGYNGKVGDQHSYAIKKSGSRYEELDQIKASTLVIHGTDDPLIYVQHSEKYAPKINDAKTLIIKGMGHDLPQEYRRDIHASIIHNFER